jgi:hypothetical protein
MKSEFPQQIFEKILHQWQPSFSMRTDGRTGGHDKYNRHISLVTASSEVAGVFIYQLTAI